MSIHMSLHVGSRSSPALHSMVPPVSYSATVRLTAQWPLSEDEDVGYFLVPSNNNAPPSIEELLTDANINKRRNKALTTTANTTAALDSAGTCLYTCPFTCLTPRQRWTRQAHVCTHVYSHA